MLKINYLKVTIILIVVLGVQLVLSESVMAQVGDLSVVKSSVRTTVNDIRTIANYIFGACIAVGAIGAIYQAASGGQRTKEFIIGIGIAVVLCALINIIVPNV